MLKKYFGTDGIRGRVGEYPITPDFFLKLGMAVGTICAGRGTDRVIIGKDTRISGYMFESALEAGFSAVGVDVLLLGPMPTPAIAYLTRTFNACIGVVVSASHNHYQDNGVKFFSKKGGKLLDHVEKKIEGLIDQNIPIISNEKLGKAKRIDDAPGRYIEHCKAVFSPQLDLSGFHLVIDTANGATYQVGPEVFKELGAKVTVIANQPNGLNINDQCGSTNLLALRKMVLKHQADLGIAFDGDGDRVLLVDSKGEIVDGDEILFIIAMHHKKKGILQGGVVGTLMSNIGIEQAFHSHNIPFFRANIGDRYVNEALIKHQCMLGGESSGHIICRHASTTGDGIIAALEVLAAMLFEGKELNEIKKRVHKFPQKIINIPIKYHPTLFSNTKVKKAVSFVEKQLGSHGRVLLRSSGTEPLIRVMVEGEDHHAVQEHAEQLANVIKQC